MVNDNIKNSNINNKNANQKNIAKKKEVSKRKISNSNILAIFGIIMLLTGTFLYITNNQFSPIKMDLILVVGGAVISLIFGTKSAYDIL